MKNKTAVEEFIHELEGLILMGDWHALRWHFRNLANKALEKEKEQIMNANIEGTEHGYRERALFGLDARPYSKKRAEDYYNQTYNQNK